MFLVWLLIGVIAAVVDREKGRSGFGWIVIKLLLGPVALILSLAMPADKSTIEDEPIQLGHMKKCPQCGELIVLESRKCRYCGQEIDVVA